MPSKALIAFIFPAGSTRKVAMAIEPEMHLRQIETAILDRVDRFNDNREPRFFLP